MQSHIRYTLLSSFVLFIVFLQGARCTTEELNTLSFIRNELYCKSHALEYQLELVDEHYYLTDRNLATEEPPKSIAEVLKAAAMMVEDYQSSIMQMVFTFKDQYMNLSHYTNNFQTKRFNPFNNLTWGSLQMLFQNERRFTDWVNTEDRVLKIGANEFTNLIGAQRPLIEEFETIVDKTAQLKQMFNGLQGEANPESPQLFAFMKQETIYYLSLIFIAAFEFEENQRFSTQDNILENYWRVFYDWLELDRCDRLVNGAINGALVGVNNLETLDAFLHSDKSHAHLDQIKLNHDVESIKALITSIPEAANLQQLAGKWSFYNENTLNESLNLSMDDQINERIEFDRLRIAEKANCLETIQDLGSFMGLKKVYIQKEKYMVSLVFYYFIEYLNIKIENEEEFPIVQKRRKAMAIIYIFLNYILTNDKPAMDKMDDNGTIIIHIIVRILNGLGPEGDFNELIKGGELDKETEEYIYYLFMMITEENDLPKPTSDELDKTRNNQLIDEDEEDPFFRIDPQGPKYMTIIRRLFKLGSKRSNQQPKFVKRYVRKYFSDSLLKENLIFTMDIPFYEMELAMNIQFKKTKQFQSTGKIYDDAKKSYFVQVATLQKSKTDPMNLLIKWFGLKLQEVVKRKVPQGEDKNRFMKHNIDKVLLGHFGSFKSNFMEMQYVEAVLLACRQFKLTAPDFQYLLENEMVETEKLNLFEFIKRVISNIRHVKIKGKDTLLDTVDINQTEFDDKTGIPNGERFVTMLLDIRHFFEPELRKLTKEDNTGIDKSSVTYQDLENTLKLIKDQFGDLTIKANKDTENFRLMMMWNLFDDLNEYMPLLLDFVDETKSRDNQGSNPLKMEMLVENYTNLYIVMLEHRIFAGSNGFSFENGTDRIENLIAYLQLRDLQYQEMFENGLPVKELRYSKLSPRQVQNLLYFLQYRLKRVLEKEENPEAENVVMSHMYFPFAFREIYALVDNHPEMNKTLGQECDHYFTKLYQEKKARNRDYKATIFTEEEKQEPGFKFCMLISFNRDMIELVETQAKENSGLVHMKTITRETMFMELVMPYYDKLYAFELIVQVFNLNMTHAQAVARESAEKFSNYIALLDLFLSIMDDLKDGINDTMSLKNLGSGEITGELKDFCGSLDSYQNDQVNQNNIVFIRHLLVERLKPGFLAPGLNLREIFGPYTTGMQPNQENVKAFGGKLRYGILEDEASLGLKPDGDEIDLELIGLLMIYSPHTEFTTQVLYENNLMTLMPMLVRNAQDNASHLHRIYSTERNMVEVYATAFQRKAKIINETKVKVDQEINDDLIGNFDFDMGMGELDDEELIETDNRSFIEEEVIVPLNQVDSNINKVTELEKVLIGTTEIKVELDSQNSHLENETLYIDEIIKNTTSGNQYGQALLSLSKENSTSGKLNINGLQIVSGPLDYAEIDMESKNFNSSTDSKNKVHTIISDNNQSLTSQNRESFASDRISLNNRCVVRLKVDVQGVNSKDKMQALIATTQNIAQRLNPNGGKVSVISGSMGRNSQVLVTKRTSNISDEIENFNSIKDQYNFTGVNDAKISMKIDGITKNIEMKSSRLNSVYGNSSNKQIKSALESLVQKGIIQTKVKNKTWSSESKSKKIVVPKRITSSMGSIDSKKSNIKFI